MALAPVLVTVEPPRTAKPDAEPREGACDDAVEETANETTDRSRMDLVKRCSTFFLGNQTRSGLRSAGRWQSFFERLPQDQQVGSPGRAV
jgi:hypothetical protein